MEEMKEQKEFEQAISTAMHHRDEIVAALAAIRRLMAIESECRLVVQVAGRDRSIEAVFFDGPSRLVIVPQESE